MRREHVIATIRACRGELAVLGVEHLFLFGSVARDQESAASDVDIIFDTIDGAAFGLFKLARIRSYLQSVLGCPVDVISQRGLVHAVALKQKIAADVIGVF